MRAKSLPPLLCLCHKLIFNIYPTVLTSLWLQTSKRFLFNKKAAQNRLVPKPVGSVLHIAPGLKFIGILLVIAFLRSIF